VGHPHAAGGAEGANLSLLQKLKLIHAKSLPGFTEDNIKELREQAGVNEGDAGDFAATCRTKISNALVAHPEAKSINPFMVLNELESGLKHIAWSRMRKRGTNTASCWRREAGSTRTS